MLNHSLLTNPIIIAAVIAGVFGLIGALIGLLKKNSNNIKTIKNISAGGDVIIDQSDKR